MKEETLPDPESVAQRAAQIIDETGRRAIKDRGKFAVALSGGSTPRLLLPLLAQLDLPWQLVHVFQVDERVAPDGHPDRNLTDLYDLFLANLPKPPAGIWTMPVGEDDMERASENYQSVLRSVAGNPPVLDLIHLGLGDDGHTASLVPGDDAISITDADVVVTGLYKGRSRMTLTYPVLNRARKILWIVAGRVKGPALAGLRRHDTELPAGRVRQTNAVILADSEAFEASRRS